MAGGGGGIGRGILAGFGAGFALAGQSGLSSLGGLCQGFCGFRGGGGIGLRRLLLRLGGLFERPATADGLGSP